MNADEDATAEPLIFVAQAVKTRGLKGEIVADLLTDFPNRFEELTELIAVGPDHERFTVELEEHWFLKDRVVLKLKGYDSIEDATVLIGFSFGIPEEDRVELPEDTYYDWELEGCAVETIAGLTIGEVAGVLRTGGVAVLAVRSKEDHEVLVPLAESIVIQIDKVKKRIVIDPPEGLLEL